MRKHQNGQETAVSLRNSEKAPPAGAAFRRDSALAKSPPGAATMGFAPPRAGPSRGFSHAHQSSRLARRGGLGRPAGHHGPGPDARSGRRRRRRAGRGRPAVASAAGAAARCRHPLHQIHPRQRPDRHRPRRPQGADRGGERLVPCRLEGRARGAVRLRPSVRAPDVQRVGELQHRLLQGHGAARRDRPERHHQQRPHQLFPERADHRAGLHPVAGERPHGPPAGRHRPGPARRAARRRPEREASGREPALRPGLQRRHRRDLARRAPLRPHRHRLDGRSERGRSRDRAAVVPRLLRGRQRRHRAGRRHHSGSGAREGRALFRRHSLGAAGHPAAALGRAHGRRAARGHV